MSDELGLGESLAGVNVPFGACKTSASFVLIFRKEVVESVTAHYQERSHLCSTASTHFVVLGSLTSGRNKNVRPYPEASGPLRCEADCSSSFRNLKAILFSLSSQNTVL